MAVIGNQTAVTVTSGSIGVTSVAGTVTTSGSTSITGQPIQTRTAADPINQAAVNNANNSASSTSYTVPVGRFFHGNLSAISSTSTSTLIVGVSTLVSVGIGVQASVDVHSVPQGVTLTATGNANGTGSTKAQIIGMSYNIT
jgi:hypothetical protein